MSSGSETPSLDALTAALGDRRARSLAMGGEERVAQQHARHKLTARERIDLLFDTGTFVEFGLLAHQHSMTGAVTEPERTPADGVVTGEGLVDGRRVYCAAYDFTVMAGSMGMVGEQKVARLRRKALLNRLPMIWLLDSAGARIQEAAGSTFAGSGALFFEQVQMSGVVPQVAAMLGPCAAGTAYIPGLADFVPMVKDTSSMSLGGARLVKAATGEETTDHDMGGSQVHCYISGVGDLEVDDDAACIAAVRDFLSFMPSNNREQPPRRDSADRRDRRIDDIEKIVPTNPRAAYDMRNVVKRVADDGNVFEVKPTFARNIITALVRLNGRPAGIVANQPMIKGGALDIDAADKAARFIWLCDAFNVPLVFLQDVPGFIVGTEVEKQGIIRHGAKMLYAVSEATVPEGDRRPPQGIRRGLFRHVWSRLRTRHAGRMADRRDFGDGTGGSRRHPLHEADRGGRRPGGGARRVCGSGAPDHRSLHRRVMGDGRRHHRPGGHSARDHRRTRRC